MTIRDKNVIRKICSAIMAVGISFAICGCTNKGHESEVRSDETYSAEDYSVAVTTENAETVAETETETETAIVDAEKNQPFTYEISEITNNLVITGIKEEYKKEFSKCMKIPTDINGTEVREIGASAFADMKIDGYIVLGNCVEIVREGAFRNTGATELVMSPELKIIEDAAFENCNFERVDFPDNVWYIGKRSFSGNNDLWSAFVHETDVIIEEAAFADCSEDFLLCYGQNSYGKNLVKEYAEENGFKSMEIWLSKTPVVNCPEEPYVLKPRIGNFFYGEDGEDAEDGEGNWCTWEPDENAPNFGYEDWQAPGCSTWCSVMDFDQFVIASSELASEDNRYIAANMLDQNRYAAWAEGADGYGIGESITYIQSYKMAGINNKWYEITKDCLEPEYDGFMRYTEVCIVNGYAKNQKVWEENSRIKKLIMYVEDEPYAYLELEDTILPQYFSLPEDDIKVMDGGTIKVRFEIADVYEGSKCDDTCLTGLVMEFSGRHAH